MTVIRSGSLEELGFEEVEPGLVEDTAENRKRIYQLEGGWQFERERDEDGMPSGLIRPISPSALETYRRSNHEAYKPVLEDPDNPWSDYVDASDFPLDAPAPDWVLARLQQWRRNEKADLPQTKPFPKRCEARRRDGTRCWNWVAKPDEVSFCGPHMRKIGRDPTALLLYAKAKLAQSLPDYVDRLEFLAFNAESEAVQLKAVTEAMDRAGLRAGQDINIQAEVTHHNPAGEVQQRILTLAERLAKRQELEDTTSPPLAVEGTVIKEEQETDVQ